MTAAVNHFNTQSRGPDGIPQCFVLAALPSIVTHLRDLFIASIKYSIFPSEWKRSLVFALNKIKTPVHQQINAHIETYHILDCMQTDFKKNNSTQTALIKLKDDIEL